MYARGIMNLYQGGCSGPLSIRNDDIINSIQPSIKSTIKSPKNKAFLVFTNCFRAHTETKDNGPSIAKRQMTFIKYPKTSSASVPRFKTRLKVSQPTSLIQSSIDVSPEYSTSGKMSTSSPRSSRTSNMTIGISTENKVIKFPGRTILMIGM